jgi:hypothetical protein
MSPKQKNTALVAAIVSGLFSLPLTWMTLRNAQMQIGGGIGDLISSTFPGFAFDVTGLNGHVTLLLKTPLWFIVCIAISASVLQLMRPSQTFAIPRLAMWGTAIVGVVWTTVPVTIVLVTGKASVGIGWLLGLFCAFVPLVCLLRPSRDANATTHGVVHPSGESGVN